MHERDDEGRVIARQMLAAFCNALAPGLTELMNRSAHEVKARALVPVICDMAPTLAPALIASSTPVDPRPLV